MQEKLEKVRTNLPSLKFEKMNDTKKCFHYFLFDWIIWKIQKHLSMEVIKIQKQFHKALLEHHYLVGQANKDIWGLCAKS